MDLRVPSPHLPHVWAGPWIDADIIAYLVGIAQQDSPPTCDPDVAKLYGTAPDTGELMPNDGTRRDSP